PHRCLASPKVRHPHGGRTRAGRMIDRGGENTADRSRTRRRFHITVAVTFVVLMAVWEAVGRLTNPLFFAPVSDIAAEFIKAVLDPRHRLLDGFLETLGLLVPGFVLASVLGVGIGVLMGRRDLAFQILDPYVNVLYNTPRVVLIPI